MSKKILHILALFSFFNFGFSTQTSFTIENNKEIEISDQSNESLEIEDIDFSDIDLSNLENLEDKEIAFTGSKEKLSLLTEVFKEMSLKDKITFIPAILKSQIKEHKKKCITIAAILLVVITTRIVTLKKKEGK